LQNGTSGGLVVRYVRWLLRHRLAATLLLVASVGLAAYAARAIRLNFDAKYLYEYEGNPAVPLLEKYYAQFGDPGGFVVVLVEARDVLAPEVLEYIQKVTRALVPDKTFSHVRSLINAKSVYGTADGIVAGELIATIPKTHEERERIRKIAVQSQLLVRRLISEDSTVTVILAEIAGSGASKSAAVQEAAIEAVQKVLATHPPPEGVRTRISGSPAVMVEGTHLLINDQTLFLPIAIVLILITSFLTFRSMHAVLLLIAANIVALVWTAGLYTLFGRPLEMVSSTIPSTLLVYGAVDPIFVLARYMGKLRQGKTRDEALEESYTELIMPCFLTSLTTALGFASYITLKVPTMMIYGATTAIGVSLAFVTTVTVLPLMLGSLPPPKPKALDSRMGDWLDDKLTRLWGFLKTHKGWVIASAVIPLILGSVIGSRQKLSVQYIGILPPGETLDSIHVLENKLTGVTRTAVLVEGEPDSMKRPEVLRAIDRIDEVARKNTTVTSTVSLADLLKEINEAFSGGENPAERKLPKSKSLVAQYLSLLDPEDRNDFVSDDYSVTHVRILSQDRGSMAWRDLQAELQAAIDTEFKGLGVKASLTGFTATLFPALDGLAVEMMIGFVVGFAIIVFFELLLFRSWRIAVLSVVPNLLPAIACFVLLALLGVPLRLGSVLFLSVSIGGLFNTTIHIAARMVQRWREGGMDPDEVMEHSLRKVGPPALFTAVTLSLGFAIFLLSRFPDLKVFGALAMTVLLCGFLSDLVVTPVLLRMFYRWGRSKRDLRSAEIEPSRSTAEERR
jgi:predicted RND superfamily exporter protein